MRITNRTRNTVLSTTTELALSPHQKAKGLMFRRSLNGGLLFVEEKPTKTSIWTVGMLIPIDILWIDEHHKVIKVKEEAKPWRYLGYPPTKAKMVLEVRAGTVKKTRTRVGDQLGITKTGALRSY